jgi:tRNA modification GTPase
MGVVAAVSTPVGTGGISIVRMTGAGCVDIAARLFQGSGGKKAKEFVPRTLYLGTFSAGGIRETCLCVVFPAPNSYTGEDMVEFQVHGGVAVTNAVLRACLENGAGMAENGDFARRAFLNGKMSLASAEGTLALISSQSLAAANAAHSLVSEKFSNTVRAWAKEITDVIASIEVCLDHPEEDIEEETFEDICERLWPVSERIYTLMSTRPTAMRVTDGINVAIIGTPNVGKSSLLNALLGSDRAIVSDIEGTTRDSITERVEYRGLSLNFIDTAGIRAVAADAVEKMGMRRTESIVNAADVIIVLVDNVSEIPDFKVFEMISLKKKIIVLNKVDSMPFLLFHEPAIEHDIGVSAKYGYNLEKLKQTIYDLVIDENVMSGALMLMNSRHYACMLEAYSALQHAAENRDLNTVAIDLRQAVSALGQITGENVSESVLNAIFENFCLGK